MSSVGFVLQVGEPRLLCPCSPCFILNPYAQRLRAVTKMQARNIGEYSFFKILLMTELKNCYGTTTTLTYTKIRILELVEWNYSAVALLPPHPPSPPKIRCNPPKSDMESLEGGNNPRSPPARYAILYPKKTCLRKRLRVKEPAFVDFVTKLLSVDPTLR